MSDFNEKHGELTRLKTARTAASTTEESDEEEDEDSPEQQYNKGDLSYEEYLDVKAQHRVDALYHSIMEVTGVDYTNPAEAHPKPKAKPLKTIGFIQ